MKISHVWPLLISTNPIWQPNRVKILNLLIRLITMTSSWTQLRLKSPASRLFTQPFIQSRIKKPIKALRHWPLCGNSPVTCKFPAQMASNAKNVSIWWRHHVMAEKEQLYVRNVTSVTYLSHILTQWSPLSMCSWRTPHHHHNGPH